jgi:hypothetical protein
MPRRKSSGCSNPAAPHGVRVFFVHFGKRGGEHTTMAPRRVRRERTEGERPGRANDAAMGSRVPAERRPASLDRFSRADQRVRCLAMQGKRCNPSFSPANLHLSKEFFIMREHFARKVTRPACWWPWPWWAAHLSFPVFSSKCAPVQHMVNICARAAGPGLRVPRAFAASLLRNLWAWGACWPSPAACAALCCAA